MLFVRDETYQTELLHKLEPTGTNERVGLPFGTGVDFTAEEVRGTRGEEHSDNSASTQLEDVPQFQQDPAAEPWPSRVLRPHGKHRQVFLHDRTHPAPPLQPR